MLFPKTKSIIVNNRGQYVQYSKPHNYLHISRYGNIPLLTDIKFNEKYHETVFNYDITKSDNDSYITINKETRLDILANKYYNDPSLWWVIAMANNIMDGLEPIKIGMVLRIPPIMSIYKNGSILGKY